jgi:hypothetical protein
MCNKNKETNKFHSSLEGHTIDVCDDENCIYLANFDFYNKIIEN